jgi:hypothetical protein
MLPDAPPLAQALLGTLFTWAVTALGAAVVFVAAPGVRERLEGGGGQCFTIDGWKLGASALARALLLYCLGRRRRIPIDSEGEGRAIRQGMGEAGDRRLIAGGQCFGPCFTTVLPGKTTQDSDR